MKISQFLLVLSLLAGTSAFARDNVVLTLEGGSIMEINRADVLDMQVWAPPPLPRQHSEVAAHVPVNGVSIYVSSSVQEPPPPAYKIVVLNMRDGRELRYNAYSIREVHIDEPPPHSSVILINVETSYPHREAPRVIVVDHDHRDRYRNHDRKYDRDHDRARDHDRYDRDHDHDRYDRDHDHRPDVHPTPDPHHDVNPVPKVDPKHKDQPKHDKDKQKKDRNPHTDDDETNPNEGHKLNRN